MSTAAGAVLLDTCAVIWLANGAEMAGAALEAIVSAGLAKGVFVSACFGVGGGAARTFFAAPAGGVPAGPQDLVCQGHGRTRHQASILHA